MPLGIVADFKAGTATGAQFEATLPAVESFTHAVPFLFTTNTGGHLNPFSPLVGISYGLGKIDHQGGYGASSWSWSQHESRLF